MSTNLSIASSANFQPEFTLPTKWFLDNETFSKRTYNSFLRQSGAENRPISFISETEMSIKALENLQKEARCDFSKCRGLVLACNSGAAKNDYQLSFDASNDFSELYFRLPDPSDIASSVRERMMGSLSHDFTLGINWGCSGFTKALEILISYQKEIQLKKDEFFVVVTVNRLSECFDFKSPTAAVFGDFATASLVAPVNSDKFFPNFEIKTANAVVMEVETSPFSVSLQNASTLGADGKINEKERVCCNFDGKIINEKAPMAMLDASTDCLESLQLDFSDVDYWIPHQAGKFVLRVLERELKDKGASGRLISRLEPRGNLSSSSAPQIIREDWEFLSGLICLPSTGLIFPGEPFMSKGYAMLERL